MTLRPADHPAQTLRRPLATTISRLTGPAIFILLAVLLLDVMFESLFEALSARSLADGSVVVSSFPGAIKNVLYVVLAVLSAIHVVATGTLSRFRTAAEIALLATVVIMIVSGVRGGTSAPVIGEALYVYFRGAIVFYAIRALDPPWPRVRQVMLVLAGVAALNAVVAVAQGIFGEGTQWLFLARAHPAPQFGRAIGLQDHPNHLGQLVGLALVATLAWLSATSRPSRWTWALLFLCAGALAFAQSRESVVGVLLATIMLAVLARGGYRRLAAATAVIFLLVAMVWVTSPRNLQDLVGRIDGVFNAIENPDPGPVCGPTDPYCTGGNPGDREVRVLLFQQALRLWTAEPIFGYGVGQFGGVVAFRNDPEWFRDARFGPEGFKLYGLTGTQVDSFWMHLGIETGAAGLVAYLVWLATVAWRPARAAWQRAKRPRAPSERARADHAMLLWAAPAVVFGVAVALLSPSLEDHLLPPLMFAMVGLGWTAAARQATDSYSAEIRRADSDSE